MKFLDEIKFDDKGLIPAVIQDYQNGEILMLAYMNRESLQKTLSSGKTHFWSRSRQKFWLKGESSGHVQEIKEVFIDCDMDTLVFKVDQKVAACHMGYRSCFYRKIEGEELTVVGEKVFEEGDVYQKS
ncbi:MAG: phosphoribosyl-AMP cyclohydrolase [Deltaproteobacteria bacterium]|jgi:phosphoribosyl-AMP cyclohydrolase|nr:phosphoribosyl-AMP cyclohydrolase [Deltaproteobacteria bacterium]